MIRDPSRYNREGFFIFGPIKKLLLIFFLFITIMLGGIVWYSIYYTARPSATEMASITEEDKNLLEPGDLILRRGEGLVSDGIASMLKEPYDITHSGIVVKQGGDWYVIHSISEKDRDIDGVVGQKLDQFVSESRKNSIIVVRYKDMAAHRDEFVQRAYYYLEQNPPFDFGFDIADSSKLYCAELIWKVFKDVYHLDIFPLRIKQPGVELLRYTPLFDERNFIRIINQQEPGFS